MVSRGTDGAETNSTRRRLRTGLRSLLDRAASTSPNDAGGSELFPADHDGLTVSVVISTNDPDRYGTFVAAVESVLDQTYPAVEIVLVVDADHDLFERVVETFGDRPNVRTHFNAVDEGLSASRNRGAEVASGDVVVFTDDDVVADREWVGELVATYDRRDALATGGPAEPIWPQREPEWLPREFYWLVGVTHDGFADGHEEVRNTFGCNLSFRRETYLELGGFRTDLGKQSGKSIQGEEAELCARLRSRFGEGVAYNPAACVGHRVFAGQIDPLELGKRAFWQGYSKRRMQRHVPDEMDAEVQFLAYLLKHSVPRRLSRLVIDPARRHVVQLIALSALTGLVGLGYLFGVVETVRSTASGAPSDAS